MKSMLKKSMIIIIAMMFITILYANKVNAVSESFEISGNGIQNVDGTYYCTKKVPVGGTLNLKAELVTKNDMHIEGTPVGETGRQDVTSECQWISSKEDIAKVENGVITGISEGVAEILVDYHGRSTSFSVGVGEEVEIGFGENIYIIQKDELKTMKTGETLQLDVEGVESLSHIKNKDVEWSSTDEKIAKVVSNGLVTGIGAGKVTIKAKYVTDKKTYESTYEITIQNVSNDDSPAIIGDDIYDFSSNKEKVEVNVGTSENIEIIAKLKEGIITIHQVEIVKDYWNAEWKVEDETIAKCIPETGIENNIHGGTQIAGRAKIQGLKAGVTQLIVKVKVSEDNVKEIKIPITVKDTSDKEEDNNKEENDGTQSKDILPQTGKNYIIIAMLGIISAVITIVSYRKLKK